MRVQTVTTASCDRCGFRQGLAEGAPAPMLCPSCGDGKPKKWGGPYEEPIEGPSRDISDRWRAYYGEAPAS